MELTTNLPALRIAELFEELDLPNSLAKRRFSELSTGNKQRLAVARATAFESADFAA